MKKVLGAVAVAAALAACNLLPTQKIDISGAEKDSIGLKGKAAAVSLLKNDLRVQAATGTFVTQGNTFADPSNITQYVNNIKEWAIQQGFNGSATVTPGVAGADCPATLTLSAITAGVKITSGANNKSFTLLPSSATLAMTETATNCQYSFNAASLLFNVNISGADLAALVGLLTDGATNTASASLSVTANELNGANTLNLTWGDTTASLTVGL